MSSRFVITSISSYQNRLFSGIFDDHKLTEVNVVSKEPPLLGRIYAAKVQNVSPNLDACFVSVGDGEIFYLPFEELEDAVFIKKTSDKKPVSCGDELLIQVKTEALKTKNAVCTCRLSIPGTFCVALSYTRGVSVSKKIDTGREKLVEIAESADNGRTGIIIRTNAQNADEADLRREISSLQQKMCNILDFGTKSMPFTCLYSDRPEYIRIFEDVCGMTDTVVTDDRDVYDELVKYANEVNPQVLDKIVFYDDDYPLNKLYSFESQIDKALKNMVHLPSGGNIVISVTEALTVVDVNTGSNIKKTDKENVLLSTNLEAAREIAFQLKLRNIYGIVIIDFIDMDANGEARVSDEIRACLSGDRCRCKVYGFTKLGLMELTRQKKRRSLYEQIKEA